MRAPMKSCESWIESSSRMENVPLSPSLMLTTARGFLLLFWSIPVALVLTQGLVEIPLIRDIHMPSYVVGLCIAYAGVFLLRKAGPLTPRWMKRTRDSMALLLIQVYLAPFYPWWTRSPQNGYYTANMLAMVMAAAWLLYTLNMTAAEWSRVVHHADFRIESELAAWVSLPTSLLPCIGIFASALAAMELPIPDEPPSSWIYSEWIRRLELLYPFPYLLTALVQWRARSLALQRCAQPVKAGG